MSVTREVTRVGPVARSRVWRGGRTVASNVTVEQIARHLEDDADTRAWWCVARDAAAIAGTAEMLGLDALAVDDVIGQREAPKLDAVGDTIVLVGAAVSFQAARPELTIARVAILATERVLVIVAGEHLLSMVVPLLDQCSGRLHEDGIAAGLHVVLDWLVGSYAAAVQAMEETTDELTASLFADRPMGRDDQLRAFRIRQAISRLRRVVSPMTEVTGELAAAAGRTADEQADDPVAALLSPSTARRFADVADHARHAADATTSLREMLTSAFETNLALSDVHLNTIMKKLSAWAAIIAVPTLITGFMGMNVPYPGFQQGTGFFAALVVMVGAVVTLFVLFRRSDWL